jgi:hypothetical protein
MGQQAGKDGTRLAVGDFNQAVVPAQTSTRTKSSPQLCAPLASLAATGDDTGAAGGVQSCRPEGGSDE